MKPLYALCVPVYTLILCTIVACGSGGSRKVAAGVKYVFLLAGCLFLIGLSSVYAQHTVRCDVPVSISELSCTKYLEYRPDSMSYQECHDYFSRYRAKSCKGEMYIEQYFKSTGKMVSAGHYKSATALDSIPVTYLNAEKQLEEKKQFHFYAPKRTGIWRFYDEKTGKLKRQVTYVNGKIVR